MLDGIFARAAELSDDPLHRFLIALKLFAEMMDDLPNGHPGCIVGDGLLPGAAVRRRGPRR